MRSTTLSVSIACVLIISQINNVLCFSSSPSLVRTTGFGPRNNKIHPNKEEDWSNLYFKKVGDTQEETKESDPKSVPSGATSDAQVMIQEKIDEEHVKVHDGHATEPLDMAGALVDSSATQGNFIGGSSSAIGETAKFLEGLETVKSIDNGSPASTSNSEEFVFEYTSPYQGLTGPSKAGLVLATLVVIGMVATSPELDWSQIDLTDFAALSGIAQHAIQDFTHNIQDGFVDATQKLSEGTTPHVHNLKEGFEGATKSLSELTAQNIMKIQDSYTGAAKSLSDGMVTAQLAMNDFIHNVQEKFEGATSGLSEVTAQNAMKIQDGFEGAAKSLSEGTAPYVMNIQGSFEGASKSLSEGSAQNTMKIQESLAGATQSLSEGATQSAMKIQDGFEGATKSLSEGTAPYVMKVQEELEGVTNDLVDNIQDDFAGITKSLSDGTAQRVNSIQDGLESVTKSLSESSAQNAMKIQDAFAGATKSLSEGMHTASQKWMGGLEIIKESTARHMEGMGERMSVPKSHLGDSLNRVGDSLSGWKADWAQDIQDIEKAVEKSASVLKDSTVSSVETTTNTINEVTQNTPSVIQEIKSNTATNLVKELKESPAVSIIKEVKPSTAAKVVKDVTASSSTSDLRGLLSDWNAQQ